MFRGDTDSLGRLGLTGPIPTADAPLMATAHKLLNTADYTPAMVTALDEHGYNSSKLSEGRGKIDTLQQARNFREACNGAQQQAVSEKGASVKTLRTWYGKFRNVARVALADKPQLLQKLGVVVRNKRTKAQRAAAAKAAATRAKNKQLKLSIAA